MLSTRKSSEEWLNLLGIEPEDVYAIRFWTDQRDFVDNHMTDLAERGVLTVVHRQAYEALQDIFDRSEHIERPALSADYDVPTSEASSIAPPIDALCRWRDEAKAALRLTDHDLETAQAEIHRAPHEDEMDFAVERARQRFLRHALLALSPRSDDEAIHAAGELSACLTAIETIRHADRHNEYEKLLTLGDEDPLALQDSMRRAARALLQDSLQFTLHGETVEEKEANVNREVLCYGCLVAHHRMGVTVGLTSVAETIRDNAVLNNQLIHLQQRLDEAETSIGELKDQLTEKDLLIRQGELEREASQSGARNRFSVPLGRTGAGSAAFSEERSLDWAVKVQAPPPASNGLGG